MTSVVPLTPVMPVISLVMIVPAIIPAVMSMFTIFDVTISSDLFYFVSAETRWQASVIDHVPWPIDAGRSVPVSLMKDIVKVAVTEEIVGRAHCHVKPKGIHIDEVRCGVKIEGGPR